MQLIFPVNISTCTILVLIPNFQDWLSPLPDNSLPHINIRKILLRILFDVSLFDSSSSFLLDISSRIIQHLERMVKQKCYFWVRTLIGLNFAIFWSSFAKTCPRNLIQRNPRKNAEPINISSIWSDFTRNISIFRSIREIFQTNASIEIKSRKSREN